MLKDNILKGLLKSNELLNNYKEKFPIGMRGELEVIVRDKDGNVTSYQKGHNTVTDWTKMQVIHLLAGEIFTQSNNLYNKVGTDIKKNSFSDSLTTGAYKIPQKIDGAAHSSIAISTNKNTDGYLVSGEPNFFDLEDNISQFTINSVEGYNNFNTPTKMLFGTGMEANSVSGAITEYNNEQSAGGNITDSIIANSNGFTSAVDLENNMFPSGNLYSNQNYYSANTNKNRTLQPLTLDTLSGDPSSTSTGIKGAIKNSYIIDDDSNTYFYDPAKFMAVGSNRGMGLPSFINAKRNNDTFYKDTKNNVYIQQESQDYEDKITYSVVMPNTQGKFYPYTGWILKEAGLFCDSRFILNRGSDTPDYTQDEYTKMPSGILMFKRNITPVVKAEDSEIEFRWSIIISV